jgi:hypothetical protein
MFFFYRYRHTFWNSILISMSSSQNYEITLICLNNMRNRFPNFVIIHRLETYHDDLTTHY